MNHLKYSKGFTIPEILVAGALFALVIVAVTVSLRVSLDIDRRADLRRQAAIKLRSAIDSTFIWSAVTNPIWETENTDPNCQLKLGGEANATVPCTTKVVSFLTDEGFPDRAFPAKRPHRITVRINWENESIVYTIYSPRLDEI